MRLKASQLYFCLVLKNNRLLTAGNGTLSLQTPFYKVTKTKAYNFLSRNHFNRDSQAIIPLSSKTNKRGE